jgi:hypothetical protein
MQQARVSTKHHDSVNARREIRAGAKGKGKVLWACDYWKNSDASVDRMNDMMDTFVRENDIQLVWDKEE